MTFHDGKHHLQHSQVSQDMFAVCMPRALFASVWVAFPPTSHRCMEMLRASANMRNCNTGMKAVTHSHDRIPGPKLLFKLAFRCVRNNSQLCLLACNYPREDRAELPALTNCTNRLKQRRTQTPKPVTAQKAQHAHVLANATRTHFQQYTATQAPGVQSIHQDCGLHSTVRHDLSQGLVGCAPHCLLSNPLCQSKAVTAPNMTRHALAWAKQRRCGLFI